MTDMWHNAMKHYKHKFKAKPVKENGKTYASSLEFAFAQYLKKLQSAQEVVMFIEQVPLRLNGGTKYVVDFLVFMADGTVRFIDVKGIETDTFKIKKREIEATYPIKIEIIKKGDFR